VIETIVFDIGETITRDDRYWASWAAWLGVPRHTLLDETDLYDDVRPALSMLREAGIRVIVAGNQTPRAAELLRGLDLPADLVVTSGEWGVAKPQREFFQRVLDVALAPPERTVYVGDHPANDVFPAKAAGLRVAHLRRGPWGHLWADDPDVAAAADWRIDNLTQLAEIVGA
jgi:HAD superfamily hydrolase (TIGR01662 family)